MRERAARVRDQLFGVAAAPGLSVTNATGTSPHFGIGPRDDRGFEHRRDAPTARARPRSTRCSRRRDDDVLGAVPDLDVAVGCMTREIAGAEPAVGRGCARRLVVAGNSRASRCCRAARFRRASCASAGTSSPCASTTRNSCETTLPTPWRALSCACSLERRACSIPAATRRSPPVRTFRSGRRDASRPCRAPPCAPASPASAARRRWRPARCARAALLRRRVPREHDRAPSARALKCVTPDSRRCRQISSGSSLRRHRWVAPAAVTRPGETPAVAMKHRQRPQEVARAIEPHVQRHRERLQVGAAVVIHHAFGRAGGAARVVDREQAALVGDRVRHTAVAAREHRCSYSSSPPARTQLEPAPRCARFPAQRLRIHGRRSSTVASAVRDDA